MSASRFHPPPWRLLAIACLCVAVLFGVVTPAPAGTLAPGGAIANDSVVSTGGTKIADTGWVPYTLTEGTGLVREIVIRGDAESTALFGVNKLTFLYQAIVSTGDITSISLRSFKGFSTDASAVTAEAQNASRASDLWLVPTDAGGSLDGATPITRTATGSIVTFEFDGGNFNGPPDANSVVMIIRTNASDFTRGFISIQDGSGQEVDGYAPTLAPEPGSMTLLGIGLAGMAGYGWRRRRQRQETGKEEESTSAVS